MRLKVRKLRICKNLPADVNSSLDWRTVTYSGLKTAKRCTYILRTTVNPCVNWFATHADHWCVLCVACSSGSCARQATASGINFRVFTVVGLAIVKSHARWCNARQVQRRRSRCQHRLMRRYSAGQLTTDNKRLARAIICDDASTYLPATRSRLRRGIRQVAQRRHSAGEVNM